MKYPLDFIPPGRRKPFFLAFLALTMSILAVFQVLDGSLRTEAAPAGMVSFELAGTPARAGQVLASWGTLNELGARSVFQPLMILAAFGLGLDYLFIPLYSVTLSLAALMAAGRRVGMFRTAGPWMGWAPFAAAALDAVENYSLLQVLLGETGAPWPQTAAWCAGIKFILLAIVLLYALAGWLLRAKAE